MSKLTPKQELFCKEYLIDLNGTQAAIRAGYSEKTARSVASENLTKPDIQERIFALREKRSKRVEINADRVLSELGKIGFSNIADMRDSWEDLKNWDEIPDEVKSLISEIETNTTETPNKDGGATINTKIKVKLHDKLSALEKIAKHLGLYEKDNRQKNNNEVDPSQLSDEELLSYMRLQDKMKVK